MDNTGCLGVDEAGVLGELGGRVGVVKVVLEVLHEDTLEQLLHRRNHT